MLARDAHGAPRDALGIPLALGRLDDDHAVGVVVEVDERLGDEPHAVRLDRRRDVGGEQQEQQVAIDVGDRLGTAPASSGSPTHIAYSAPCGLTWPRRPPSAAANAASAPIWYVA